MFAIRNGRLWVARPGRRSSYTNRLYNAMLFETVEEAQRHACPDEQIVQVDRPLITPDNWFSFIGKGN